MIKMFKIQSMFDKYLLSSKNLSLQGKKFGYYYVFRTPNNQLYVVDDESFQEKLCGPFIKKNIRPDSMRPEDTFTIQTNEFRGLLQYKYRVLGEYYIMNNEKNNKIFIRAADMEY